MSVWDRGNGKDWKLEAALFLFWWSANHKRIMMIFFAHLVLISPKTGRRTESYYLVQPQRESKIAFHVPPFPFRLGKF